MRDDVNRDVIITADPMLTIIVLVDTLPELKQEVHNLRVDKYQLHGGLNVELDDSIHVHKLIVKFV